MDWNLLLMAASLAPAALMAAAALPLGPAGRATASWRSFQVLAALAFAGAVAALALRATGTAAAGSEWRGPGLAGSAAAAWMAVLVQALGTVIGVFSARYLQGEANAGRYRMAFAGVLAAVHLLLLADHWLVLIAAWALVGAALQRLLCFYPERAFAQLAAYKKRLADRLADALLLAAAALAWAEVGSGSLSELLQHATLSGASPLLQACAVCLVLAVIVRTALLPVHGWLIQVMEAPTPVSALLHAGVVNLGAFVLIRFAPLLDASPAARWLLVASGLATAVLAGLVMLTRVSIKVRLAWSTVAQMGFVLLQCGLGLYSLAALHLIGHSLYKAHAFLAASSIVRQTKLAAMRGVTGVSPASLMVAPLVTGAMLALLHAGTAALPWPWWWSGVLALGWAPLLWWPSQGKAGDRTAVHRLFAGVALAAGLGAAALALHALPLGTTDVPHDAAGIVAAAGMAAMYLCLVALHLRPQRLATVRRWSYAGFYVDELLTRLALRLWPARWMPAAGAGGHPAAAPAIATR